MTNQQTPEHTTNDDPLLFTLEEVRQRLRVSRWMVCCLLNKRQLTAIRIGKRRLVTSAELQAYIARLEEEERDYAG